MFILLLCLLSLWLITKIFQRKAQQYFKSEKFIELSRQTDDVTELYEKLIDSQSRIRKSFYSTFSPVIIKNQIEKHPECQNRYICDPSICAILNTTEGYRKVFAFSETPAIKQKITDIVRRMIDFNKNVEKLQVLREDMFKIAKDSVPKWILFFYPKQSMLLLGLDVQIEILTQPMLQYEFDNKATGETISMNLTPDDLAPFVYENIENDSTERTNLQTIADLLKIYPPAKPWQ